MSASNKIIINYLKLKNWGPFIDEKIQFPYDEKQNVTYIAGINGRGKSSIFDALNACLFGPEYAGLLNYRKLNIEQIINKHVQYDLLKKSKINKANCDVYLELNFSVFQSDMTEIQYIVYRTWSSIFSWKDDKKKEKVTTEIVDKIFEFKEDIGGSTEYSNDWGRLKSIIDKLIPSGPREFYFLDGEHIAELFRFDNLDRTQGLALLNSEIPQLKILVKLLEKIKKRYRIRKNRAIKAKKSDQEKVDNLNKRITQLQKDIEQLEKQIEEKQELINNYKIDLRKIRNQIKKSTISKQQLEKYENLRSSINKMQDDITEKRKKLSKILKKSAPFLCLDVDVFEEVIKLLNVIEEKKIIPAPIPSDIIELIIMRPKCVCGHDITDVEKKHMTEHIKSSIEQELDGLVKRFRNRIHQYTIKIPKWKQKLKALKLEIVDLNKKKDQAKKEFETISIPGIDADSLKDLFRKDENLSDRIGRFQADVTVKKKIIEENNEKIKEAEEDLLNLSGKESKEHLFNKNKEEYTESLINEFNNMIGKIEEDILKDLEKNTSTTFKKLISNPTYWDGVRIEPNWEITPIKKGGVHLKKISAGETQVLGISFMAALSNIVKHIIPFVFDSPFGRISVKSAGTIGSTIPNLLSNQQMILFLTDTEHNNIFKFIKDRISKAYILTMDSTGKAEIINKTITEIEKFGEP